MVEIFQNIRKIYDFRLACDELINYIEFYSQSITDRSIATTECNYSSVKMFPSWTPTMYINLGVAYYIDLKSTRYYIHENEDVLILRDGDVTRHKMQTDNIFTIKFHPGGLESILGISQISLVNKVIDLNRILPHQLLDRIKRPISFEERVILIETYLLASFSKRKDQDYYIKIVNDCIGDYLGAGMQLNTSAVAERSFITSKSINRYFNKVIGTSPKNFFSILRCRKALTAFINDRENFTPIEFGYYDLSHFHKDIINFTGKKLSNHDY